MTTRVAAPVRFRLLLPALVAAALALGSIHSARAEIVDFDPMTGSVPDLLGEGDLATIEALKSAGFVYAYSRPNPAGTAMLAALGANGIGFVNLDSGDIVPLAESPSGQFLGFSWRDDNTLGVLAQKVQTGPGNAVTVTYAIDLVNATTGAVSTSETVTLPPKALEVVSASPDLKTLLILESDSTAPPPFKTVTLGENPFDVATRELPDGLPGRVGARPLGKFKVYQSTVGLALMDAATGLQRSIMSLPAGTAVNPYSVAWSADGASVAFASTTMPDWDGDRQRNNNPPAGGLPNLGSINVREALGLVKPEDNPLVAGTNMYVFAAATGARQATLKNSDLKFKDGLLVGLVFMPNGQGAVLALAMASHLEGRPHPVYSQPAGMRWAVLGPDFQVRHLLDDRQLAFAGAPEFLPNGELAFAVPMEYSTRIVKLDPASGAMTTLWAPRGSIFQMMVQANRVLFSQQDVDDPIEFWSANANDAVFAPHRVTDISADARAASRIRTREVSWHTSDDQWLTGYYVYPDWMLFPPPTPQPLIVWQQGGPGGQMTNDFGTNVEQPYTVLANLGMPVFVANAAGRNVTSPQFYSDMAEGTNFGQLDIRQIKEGVDALIAKGIADPKAIGITGCSYGGYFTLQSLRTFPTFYAAANPQCSLVDLFEEFTFGYTPFVGYLEGTSPMADPQEFKLDSPLYGTKDVKTPTLLFHGMLDFLPIPLINNVHDQLVANGTPAKLIRFAREGHGLGAEASQALAIQEQVKFFRDRLGAKPVPAGASAVREIFVPSVAR